MRVLLINPFYPISETPSPPLGLAYLASALIDAGAEVEILDLVVFPYTRSVLQKLVERFRPRIAGITAVTMTFDNAVKVIKDLKDIDPNILTVMGGPHVSFCARETLAGCSELDIVVLGEGERTMVELSSAVDNGSTWDGVDGIAYRFGNQIRFNKKRKPIANLDELPVPARHLLPLGRYKALGMPITLTTSRGCPFGCIFCVGRKMVGAKVRYRSPHNIVDELQYLSTLNFHQINIADDLFTANKNHCLAVCDDIINRGLKLKWTSFARVDTVSEDMLNKMKAAGCHAVSFGIESANRRILKTIKKGITPEQVVEAVDMCRKSGITPHGSFILGLPGETPETIEETMEFGKQLKKLGLSYGFHLLAPFPGTEVREQSDRYGIEILTDDWSRYHANRAIVQTPTVNHRTLDKLVIEWEDEFNQLLADIKHRTLKNEASEEEKQQITNLEHIVLVYDLMMKRTIEQNGFWHHEGGPLSMEDSLKALSDRISPLVDTEPTLLRTTLDRALEQGSLYCRVSDGTTQWHWVDYLG
jgi:radical SAM superfamily enzyme YgiQ (UPF0313 family)